MVSAVLRSLYKEGGIFYLDDILNFLEKNPRLLEINKQIVRNEGYIKSLLSDKLTR